MKKLIHAIDSIFQKKNGGALVFVTSYPGREVIKTQFFAVVLVQS
jgi:hypothetical protein